IERGFVALKKQHVQKGRGFLVQFGVHQNHMNVDLDGMRLRLRGKDTGKQDGDRRANSFHRMALRRERWYGDDVDRRNFTFMFPMIQVGWACAAAALPGFNGSQESSPFLSLAIGKTLAHSHCKCMGLRGQRSGVIFQLLWSSLATEPT